MVETQKNDKPIETETMNEEHKKPIEKILFPKNATSDEIYRTIKEVVQKAREEKAKQEGKTIEQVIKEEKERQRRDNSDDDIKRAMARDIAKQKAMYGQISKANKK